MLCAGSNDVVVFSEEPFQGNIDPVGGVHRKNDTVGTLCIEEFRDVPATCIDLLGGGSRHPMASRAGVSSMVSGEIVHRRIDRVGLGPGSRRIIEINHGA